MSHVDEGTLHAYLDGELPSAERATLERHLETCAACRGLLTEERALLARASALLGSARPVDRPAPPFEQVRRPSKRSPWRSWSSLAWAASIVLAVGLGYYMGAGAAKVPSALNDGALRTSRVTTDSFTTVAAAPPADKAAESVHPTRRPRAQAPAADRVEGRDAAAAASGARVDSAPALIAQQPAVQLRGAGPAERQREADSAALEETPVTVAAPAAVGAAQPRGESAKGNAVRNLVSTTWPLISQGAATSMLGERPLGIPGLATRRIRRSPAGDTVVVEQALNSSTVIQIFQHPASNLADAGVAENKRESAGADRLFARYVGRLRVEIAGPVSTDSLNKLLEQVEPLP